MIQLYRRPAPPLSEYVDALWYFGGYVPAHSMERVLPDGSMQIIINLHDGLLRIHDSLPGHRVVTYRGPLLCGAMRGTAV